MRSMSLILLSIFLLSGCAQESSEGDAAKAQPSQGKTQSTKVDEEIAVIDSMVDSAPSGMNVEPVLEQNENLNDASTDVSYAGEEFFASEPVFSPKVQEAIDSIEGRASRPAEERPLKPEYQKLADVLESQIDGQ